MRKAVQSAANHLANHLVDNADATDPNQWLHAAYLINIEVSGVNESGTDVSAHVAGWVGRGDGEYKEMPAETGQCMSDLIAAVIDSDPTPRVAVVRITRFPKVTDDLELDVFYSEVIFAESVDVSDPGLGGHALFEMS